MATTPTPSDRLQAELEFITELSAVVAEQSELQPILDWIVDKTTVLLGADECTIKLLGPDQSTTHTIVQQDRRDRGAEAGSRSWPMAVRTSVMGFLMVHRAELASSDLTADPRFAGLRGLKTNVRAVLALPLVVDGRITGMLAVCDSSPGREWTPLDTQLMSIIASHSAGTIEKARLRGEAEQKRILELEKEKMEKELLVARDIQMRLVPDAPLRLGPWEATGQLVPARQVGGDYFDYFALDEQRFAVAIGDVSGKGVPAALLVSSVQGLLRAFCDGHRTPHELVREVNRAISRTAAPGKFVTFFYGEVDHGAGRLRFVNAGHNYPLLRRADGTIETLSTGGVPLGLFAGAEYETGEAAFAPGDSLLLFSDGVTEAVDTFEDMFGDERLEALWREAGDASPSEFLARLLDEVAAFRGSAGQNDDITAVVVRAPSATSLH